MARNKYPEVTEERILEARDGNDAVIVEALHYRSEAVRRIERAAGTHLPICTPAGFAVPITELGAVVGVLALAVVDLTEHTLLDHCADKLKFGHIAVVLCVHISCRISRHSR